jgi:hypothetical protein
VIKLSEAIQLEQLLNEKTGMETEARELDEEQKQLKLRAKMLTEKIIQELRKKNNAKQDAVNTLQSKVGELESQLNSLSVSSGIGTNDIPESNREETTAEAFEEETHTTDDDSVSVTEVAEETLEESIDSKDKRKRKFF